MKNIKDLFEEHVDISTEEARSCLEIKVEKDELIFIVNASKQFSYPRSKINKEINKEYIIHLLSFLKNNDISGLKRELKKQSTN